MGKVRDTLGTSIYFMSYESSKQLLTTYGGDSTHSNPLAVLVAGGLCGVVSWAMICMCLFAPFSHVHPSVFGVANCLTTDPIDSAKSNYQRNALMFSKGQKVQPVKIQFFRRHMYRGLGVSVARSCALNAIFFSSFEFLKKRINTLEDRPGW